MYWPALIIGLVVTAYWGRVLRLVHKVGRQTGSGASFRPAERLGRKLRMIWYPAAGFWVVYPYIAGSGKTLPAALRPVFVNQAISWVAAAVGVAALWGTMLCWKRMGKSWRMGINPEEKTQLIVSGPYGYVRHPIYALSSVLMGATMAAMASPAMLVVGAIHLGLLQWEAVREEKHLVKQHGQGYVEYCRHVGRFVPKSLQPYHGQ